MHAKRILSAIAGLGAVALLAGCAGGGDTANGGGDAGEKNVKVWLYPVIADEAKHKAFWDKTVADFEKANEGITVDYEIFPWANRDEALQTAIAAKKGPDLVYLIPDQLAAYQKSIEPLGEHMSDAAKGDILPNVVESVSIDGKMMGAPILTSSNPLICNAAAFKEAGVSDYPTTWDDVLEMAPKFTAKGMYAINYPAAPENTLNMTFYPLIWQAGGSVFNEDGTKVGFDSPAGEKALDFISTLAQEKAIEPDALTTNLPLEQTAVAKGKVGCTWTNVPSEVESFWGKENIVVLPALTEEKSVAYGTVGSLAMLKDSKAQDAATKFAEYATSADVVVPYLKEGGFFSALTSTGALYADDPVLSKMEETIPSTTVGELFGSSREVMGVLSPEIQAALLGQKKPDAALKDAAAAAAPLLGN